MDANKGRANDSRPMDLAAMAAQVDLRYVNDEQVGLCRKRRGKGFIYCTAEGAVVRDRVELMRLKGLMIPPAWTDVWICMDPDGHIQATGRDEKGRKQYVYHTRWATIRDQVKYNRLLVFAEALPALRRQLEQDLKLPGLPRPKVVAIVVRLLEETLIRIGNPAYVRQNKSYGLTTLRKRHLNVTGSALQLKFKGKSGVKHEIAIEDRRLVRLIKKCQELPGQQLFQYLDEAGERRSVHSEDVNSYLQTISGEAFTAKDFRTWGGTVAAAQALYQLGPAETERQRKTNLRQAVQQTAHALGNTTTVCRKYYVHPVVFAAYTDGSLFTTMRAAEENRDSNQDDLDWQERAVRQLLY